jgi:hypothetical protein
MSRFARRTNASILLRLLDYAVDNDTYARVLRTLGTGIKIAAGRIETAARQGPDDYADAVVDEETEIIESLLGTACVLCQTPITAVTQAALQARRQGLRDGRTFLAFTDKSHEVRTLGDPFDTNHSKIEVLWALGNYFKHRDEWTRSTWTKPTGLAAFTVPLLLAAGLAPSSTGNLRTGAEALGNSDYSNMSVFEGIVQNWANEVRVTTKQAFER